MLANSVRSSSCINAFLVLWELPYRCRYLAFMGPAENDAQVFWMFLDHIVVAGRVSELSQNCFVREIRKDIAQLIKLPEMRRQIR